MPCTINISSIGGRRKNLPLGHFYRSRGCHVNRTGKVASGHRNVHRKVMRAGRRQINKDILQHTVNTDKSLDISVFTPCPKFTKKHDSRFERKYPTRRRKDNNDFQAPNECNTIRDNATSKTGEEIPLEEGIKLFHELWDIQFAKYYRRPYNGHDAFVFKKDDYTDYMFVIDKEHKFEGGYLGDFLDEISQKESIIRCYKYTTEYGYSVEEVKSLNHYTKLFLLHGCQHRRCLMEIFPKDIATLCYQYLNKDDDDKLVYHPNNIDD